MNSFAEYSHVRNQMKDTDYNFFLKSVENEGLGGTNFKDSIPEVK